VVEDQRDPVTAPDLTLTAVLAHPLLDALGVQAALERRPAVARVLDEHFLERLRRCPENVASHCGSIEVVCRDLPDLVDPPAEEAMIAAMRLQAESSQGVRVTE
jgi:hypothetical protein